jgi:arginyl-tRNA synthetase
MRNLLAPLIDDTLAALKERGQVKLAAAPAYTVDPPKNPAHGDLSCNVAMVMAKGEGQPPRKLAELIAQSLVDAGGIVAKVDVAGPGFLNFTLKDAVVQRVARDVLAAGASWGRRPPKSTGKRVNVEFVSANPTGPVHIGHARGSFTGDAIARLLEAAGHDVTREFYINDFGKQVETLGRTVHKRYLQLFGAHIELADGEYPAQYVVDIATKLKEADGDRWVKASAEEALERCTALAIEENLAAIRASLEKAHIRHDVFSSEAALHREGKVLAVVEHYKKRGVTYDADRARGTEDKVRRDDSKAAQFADRQMGGTFLVTSEHGDEEDRIVLRKDGTPVYLTADLAYHKDKLDRGFDRIVDVFGADHSGHVPRIKAGVKLLGYEEGGQTLDFVLVQMVRITRDGQEVRVSKRKGTVYELDDLLDDVGADPCRFLFLMRTTNAQFDFDLALVEKQSKDNPVFYFQYGHARCAQILKKAAEEGKPFVGAEALTDAQLAKLVLPEERALLKKIAALPDVVVAAAEALEPHRVLSYCGELIGELHGYYTKYKRTERVLSDDDEKTQGRLALIAALKATLKSAFAILGVDAPEHMASLAAGEGDTEED